LEILSAASATGTTVALFRIGTPSVYTPYISRRDEPIRHQWRRSAGGLRTLNNASKLQHNCTLNAELHAYNSRMCRVVL
jgi:hypothetical protein